MFNWTAGSAEQNIRMLINRSFFAIHIMSTNIKAPATIQPTWQLLACSLTHLAAAGQRAEQEEQKQENL